MAFYTVTRSIETIEVVITEAKSKHEAFQNAGDDIKCVVQRESSYDYEPDYQSIEKVRYVLEATIKEIRKES